MSKQNQNKEAETLNTENGVIKELQQQSQHDIVDTQHFQTSFVSKVLHTKHILLYVLTLLVLLFGVGVLVIGRNQQKAVNMQKVNNEVSALFNQDNPAFLTKNIEKSQLNNVKGLLTRYRISQVSAPYKKYQEAESKYQLLLELNEVFDTDSFMVNGDQIDQNTWVRTDLTKEEIETLKSKSQLSQWARQDDMTNAVRQLYDEAINSFDNVTKANDAAASVEARDLAALNTQDATQKILDIDKVVAKAARRRDVKKAQLKVQELAKPLKKRILEAMPEEGYTEEEVNTLFSSQALASVLINTPVDTRKIAVLTFDDGPFGKRTRNVVDVLDKYGVRGTFFELGKRVEADPDLTREIRDRGHVIGNHTYSHPDLSQSTDDIVNNEIEWANNAFVEALGEKPTVFRMPFGSGGERVVKLIEDHEMSSVIWNVDSADWALKNTELIVNTVKDNIRRQSLILFHDTIAETADAVDILIPWLQEQGYIFLTADEFDLGVYSLEDR